jgi:hypothetical protein
VAIRRDIENQVRSPAHDEALSTHRSGSRRRTLSLLSAGSEPRSAVVVF